MNQHIELRSFSLQYSTELFALTDCNRLYLRRWLLWLNYVQTAEDSAAFVAQNIISDQEGKTLNYFIF